MKQSFSLPFNYLSKLKAKKKNMKKEVLEHSKFINGQRFVFHIASHCSLPPTAKHFLSTSIFGRTLTGSIMSVGIVTELIRKVEFSQVP